MSQYPTTSAKDAKNCLDNPVPVFPPGISIPTKSHTRGGNILNWYSDKSYTWVRGIYQGYLNHEFNFNTVFIIIIYPLGPSIGPIGAVSGNKQTFYSVKILMLNLLHMVSQCLQYKQNWAFLLRNKILNFWTHVVKTVPVRR